MPEFMAVSFAVGMLLQARAWAQRLFFPRAACARAASMAWCAGAALVALYAWHDADFALFVGQMLLAAVFMSPQLRPACADIVRRDGRDVL